MLCYSRPQLLTHCGLAVLNLQNEYGQPFAKTEFPLPPVTQVMLKTWSRLRPSLLLPAFLFGVCNRRKRVDHVNKNPVFCVLQTKSICILWDTGGKASYTFPSCVHVDFPASDANPVHFPLVEFCVPCVPSDTGGTPPQPAVPQNHARPRFAPRRPVLAGFHPRWGNDPSQPGQGAVWATQGSVWQKEKKTAQPGKQPPAQTKNTPALGFPSGTRVPQNQQW